MKLKLLITCISVQIFLISVVEASRPNYPPRFLVKKSCRFEESGCKCIIRLRGECCCKGPDVMSLPQNLTSTIRVLVMFNTSISSMGSNFFADYPNLEEIEIYDSPHLEHFDGNSLRNLTNLRKFSITWCRKLEEVSEVLLEKNLKIQSLILRDNSLKRMPGLQMSEEHKMDVEVDLSGNQIGYIGDGRVRGVRARSLRISHNKIKEIAGYAFSGSSFLKLALNGNEELSDLSTDAFKNIIELHHLDLSDTSIRELPINGLKNLKSLTLRNVHTLKRLPSVLSFTHLETAHFTYPHHCCLFKYVDDVVEGENGLYKNNVKEIHNRICKEREKTERSEKRILRQAHAPSPSPVNDLWSNLFEQWLREDVDEVNLPLDDDDPPAYDPSEIGVMRCLAVEEVATVQGFYQNITCTPQPDALNPCENIVGYWVLRKTIWVVWVLAFVGNILVWIILSLAYERRMRVHYLFMINLSIADLITGIYLAFLAIQDVRTADEYYRHAVDWQTSLGCNAAGFLAVFASKLSIISMFLIAFEMAYNTRKAFYGHRMNYVTGWGLMVGGWLFSIFMATLPLLGVSSYSATSICLPIRMENVFDRTYIISFLMFNIFAFAGMAVCYAFLICMLKNPRTPSRAEDKDIMLKMALLVGTDMLCRFPTLIVGVFAAMGKPLISLSDAKILLVVFFPINAFANPFLYVFCTKVIQRNVKTKAMPVIRRITSTSGVALNSLSNFYHSQPPGNPRHDLSSSPSRLAVTQVTSLNSTPRESNCSSHKAVDSLDPSDNTRRSSPRVSFQDDFSTTSRSSSGEYSRRSFGLLKRISALPVSAIPEVSDLSEHSSESHHEHIPKQRRRRFTIYRSLGRYRNESARSAGQDSGRGSLTSIGTRDTFERYSLISGTTESDGEATNIVKLYLANLPQSSSTSLGTPSTNALTPSTKVFQPSNIVTAPRSFKLSLFPRKLIDRRRSAPLITPQLVVSDFSDI